jgi:hypothetical protein
MLYGASEWHRTVRGFPVGVNPGLAEDCEKWLASVRARGEFELSSRLATRQEWFDRVFALSNPGWF